MFAIPHSAEHSSEITDIVLDPPDPSWFEDVPYDDIGPFPEPPPFDLARETPAARLARERHEAAIRQRTSRARRKAQVELDSAIASAMANILRRNRAHERIRAVGAVAGFRLHLEPVLKEAGCILVAEMGWDRTVAAKAVNGRLIR